MASSATLLLDPALRHVFPASSLFRKGEPFTMADFEVDGHPLGAGRFGTAWRVRHKRTRRVLVLKSLVKSAVLEEGVLSQLRREAEVHTRLKHANVVECFGYFEHAEAMYLVLEYANGGTLYEYVQSLRDKRLGDREAAVVVQQVASALQYLHGLNVIHRDIKPENLLLFWPEGTGPGSTTTSPATGAAVPVLPIVKLCDLGWSVPMRLDSKRFTLCGTVEYLPPEVAQGREYAFAYDMWTLGALRCVMPCFAPSRLHLSLLPLPVCLCPLLPLPFASAPARAPAGILAYELLVGHSPFMPQEPGAVVTQEVIWARAAAGRYAMPAHVKRSAQTLIAALLRVDHDRRIGPAAVLAHPWVATYAGESPTASAAASSSAAGALALGTKPHGPGRVGVGAGGHLSMGVGPSAASSASIGLSSRGASAGPGPGAGAGADPMAAAAGMCIAPWPDMRTPAAGSPAALAGAAEAFQARTRALLASGVAPLPLSACINRRAAEVGLVAASPEGEAAPHQPHHLGHVGHVGHLVHLGGDVLSVLAEAIADGALPPSVIAAMERVLGQSVAAAAAAGRAEEAALSAPLAAAAAAAVAGAAGVTASGVGASASAGAGAHGHVRSGPSYAAIAAAGGSSAGFGASLSAAPSNPAVAATPVRQAPRGGFGTAATAPRSAVAMRSHTPGHAMLMAAAAASAAGFGASGFGASGLGAAGGAGPAATPGRRGAMRVPPTPSALAPAFAAAAAAASAAASLPGPGVAHGSAGAHGYRVAQGASDGSAFNSTVRTGHLLPGQPAAAAPSATAIAALAAAVPLATVPLAPAPAAANSSAVGRASGTGAGAAGGIAAGRARTPAKRVVVPQPPAALFAGEA